MHRYEPERAFLWMRREVGAAHRSGGIEQQVAIAEKAHRLAICSQHQARHRTLEQLDRLPVAQLLHDAPPQDVIQRLLMGVLLHNQAHFRSPGQATKYGNLRRQIPRCRGMW